MAPSQITLKFASLLALLLGVTISVPLGIWVTRRPSLEAGVLGVASVMQTIPSLALLALMVPILAGIGAASERFFGLPPRDADGLRRRHLQRLPGAHAFRRSLGGLAEREVLRPGAGLLA